MTSFMNNTEQHLLPESQRAIITHFVQCYIKNHNVPSIPVLLVDSHPSMVKQMRYEATIKKPSSYLRYLTFLDRCYIYHT